MSRRFPKAHTALAKPSPQVRPEVLLEFVRQLVQNTANSDVLWLVLRGTQKVTGATDEEIETLVAAIRQEHRESPRWPKGFFGDF